MKSNRPILCLDFDGVIHSYTSGWKGATNIPDPPVEGMLEALVIWAKDLEVSILSSRSHQWGGRRAMQRWLIRQYIELGDYDNQPEWFVNAVAAQNSMDPWYHEVNNFARDFIRKTLKWPSHKPAAVMTIDDRAVQFMGPNQIPTTDDIRSFQPWYKT